ncbi:blastula protease 10-like [Etheostoma cragini]|uniref:blastula protease 10-like n=1 Tax=Etheostoma cragini TaxID=417921 RepID=UPI00155F3C5F|nr:blastula protease 10-like [Etheostoma cragini]
MLHLVLAVLLLAESSTNVDASPAPGAAKDDVISRVAHYMASNPETLYELMTNDAVAEGDIVLSDDRNAVDSIWPTPHIPYEIHPELASRTHDIHAALAMLSNPTCVSFHERTTESNYLFFDVSAGCASYVGFIGGVQSVFIGPACTVGNIAHELLHALGLYHEHTRADRDKYILISPSNIMQGMQKNFKIQQGKTFELDYDVGSIMHYGSHVFSANGQPTIQPKSDVRNMGQRVRLTHMDIVKVKLLYRCGMFCLRSPALSPQRCGPRFSYSQMHSGIGGTDLTGSHFFEPIVSGGAELRMQRLQNSLWKQLNNAKLTHNTREVYAAVHGDVGMKVRFILMCTPQMFQLHMWRGGRGRGTEGGRSHFP